MRMVSALWSSASALARGLAGERVRLGARVISVGNLQAGGAGKTPLVGRIAREADARGILACILTRGYGGRWEGAPEGGVIAPGEQAPPAALCGDEAALLHELAPGAWIGVGADRARQFERARERAGGSLGLAILDDGFQNHRLHKDVELVAVTSARPGERVFRDWPGAARRASLLVWTKGEERPPALDAAPGVPWVRMRYFLRRTAPPERILLLTGLADGDFARRSAEEAGYEVLRHCAYPDHACFDGGEAAALLQEAKASGARLAVTGKDWVKLREVTPLRAAQPPVLVLEPELSLEPPEEGARIWNRVLWGE